MLTTKWEAIVQQKWKEYIEDLELKEDVTRIFVGIWYFLDNCKITNSIKVVMVLKY